MNERERAPIGVAAATHPDPGSWGLLWIPVLVCLGLLLFMGLSPDESSARVGQSNQGSSQCKSSAPDSAAAADSRC